MGHDVLYCEFCDTAVMEGGSSWECNNCGAVCYGKEWIKKDDNMSKKRSKIYQMNYDEYDKLVTSGMFWELYPEATGNYHNDKRLSHAGIFKIEEDEN